MYDEYGPYGFEPIAINLWQDMNTVVKTFARQYSFTFLRDAGTAWNLYKITNSIPLNFVVDTAGIVVGGMVGFTESTIRAWIEPYLTGVSETPRVQPLEFAVLGANPAVGRSMVRFSLPKATNVTLRVYSTSGALVRTLVNGQMPAGANTVNWDLCDESGRRVGNGLYVYALTRGSQVARVKVSVVN